MFDTNKVYDPRLLSPAQRAYAKKAVKAGQIEIIVTSDGKWRIKRVEQSDKSA